MKICKCRHPEKAHNSSKFPVREISAGSGECRATIHAGQYSYPCDCRKYEETY